MLSLQKVRELLPNDREYADDEIEEIRSSMQELASLAFDSWMEEKKGKPKVKD